MVNKFPVIVTSRVPSLKECSSSMTHHTCPRSEIEWGRSARRQKLPAEAKQSLLCPFSAFMEEI